MRSGFFAFVATLVLVTATGAFADSVTDPKIIIRDPVCPGSGCIQAQNQFSFQVPGGGTGAVFFTNASGNNWFNLKLTETGVPANLITCITDVWAKCTVTTAANGVTTILLSGLGPNFPGILAGENFSIVFGCETGRCDPWPGGLQFTAVANVPEPGTMALVLTGLGLIVRRKRRHAAI
jgi:hypothetical protein